VSDVQGEMATKRKVSVWKVEEREERQPCWLREMNWRVVADLSTSPGSVDLVRGSGLRRGLGGRAHRSEGGGRGGAMVESEGGSLVEGAHARGREFQDQESRERGTIDDLIEKRREKEDFWEC